MLELYQSKNGLDVKLSKIFAAVGKCLFLLFKDSRMLLELETVSKSNRLA